MKKIISVIIFFLLSIGIVSAQHLKKDGTPDMRYKENKGTTTTTPAPTPAPATTTPSGTTH